jgi:hypothetical protein
MTSHMRVRREMHRIFCLAFLIFFVGGVAAARDCPREDAMRAEDIAAALKSWGRAYAAFKRYSHCDDGAISEGFTDSIVLHAVIRLELVPTVSCFNQEKC